LYSNQQLSIESVKTTAQLFAPASLEVVNANKLALNDPSRVNKSAESEGWIIDVELENIRELESLLDEKSYNFLIEQQNKE
jgi:glycine cleavage system H protein